MSMNYIERYRALCAELRDCTDEAEVIKHNRAMKKLSALFREIGSVEDKCFMLELLKDADPRTRLLAASHCLGLNVYVPQASAVLKRLSKDKRRPIAAFEAAATLKTWKKNGGLDF